jgi:hypothetical protein
MAKKPTLVDLTSQYGAQSTINGNNALIEASFENTLSLDGSSPNSMQADFDLNSNDLLNAATLYADTLILGGSVITPTTSLTLLNIAASNVDVIDGGGYWVGANVETILAEIGVDLATKQPLDNGLTSIAALTTAADKMLYTTAFDTYALADLTAAGRALLDDADNTAQRVTLGLGTFAVEDTADYVLAQGTWDAGVATTEATISPAKLKDTIDNSLNVTGAAPIFQARAWVNFNGTGVVAIRDSGNVTSVIDNGLGDYTVNFTTPMPDANYAFAASGGDNAGTAAAYSGFVFTDATKVLAGSIQFWNVDADEFAGDATVITMTVFR